MANNAPTRTYRRSPGDVNTGRVITFALALILLAGIAAAWLGQVAR